MLCIIEVVKEYIRQKEGLRTMEKIHQRVFDEDKTFSTWSSVIDEYSSLEWNEELKQEFMLTSRNLVEGGLDRIPETYFDIKQPRDLSNSWIHNQFTDKESDEATDSEFRYEVRDGIFHVVYVYSNSDLSITTTGKVIRQSSEDTIQFRIDPMNN